MDAPHSAGRWVLNREISNGFNVSLSSNAQSDQNRKLYNKTARFLKTYIARIHYAPPPRRPKIMNVGEVEKYRIACYAGAGFSTLHGERSIASNVAISGEVL